MGKWSTYRRRGGGVKTFGGILRIVTATLQPQRTLVILYSGNVNAAAFSPDAFVVSPGAFAATSIAQGGDRAILVTWPATIVLETLLTYAGTTPGIKTPDTMAITQP